MSDLSPLLLEDEPVDSNQGIVRCLSRWQRVDEYAAFVLQCSYKEDSPELVPYGTLFRKE